MTMPPQLHPVSHTWGADDEEVAFEDIIDSITQEKNSYRELQKMDWEDLGDGLKVERSRGSPPDDLEPLSMCSHA